MPDKREIADLSERARRARYVARLINDKEAASTLMRYAEELETRAEALEGKTTLPRAAEIRSSEPAAVRVKPDVARDHESRSLTDAPEEPEPA